MGIIKRGTRTINSIIADDPLILIDGGSQATLTNDLSHIGKYTNYDDNYYPNIDLTTLDDNIKILDHGKMRLRIGDSVIELDCYYAPSAPYAIINESSLI